MEFEEKHCHYCGADSEKFVAFQTTVNGYQNSGIRCGNCGEIQK